MTSHLLNTPAATHQGTASWRLRSIPVALLLLGLCSCANTRQEVAGDPFTGSQPQLATHEVEETDKPAGIAIERAIHQQPQDAFAVSNEPANTDGPIVRMSGEVHGDGWCPTGNGAEACPPGGYLPPVGPQNGSGFPGGHALFAPAGPMVVAEEGESQVKYWDEYIYDGGDRDISVHYTGFGLDGLDPEDALVEYRDDLGTPHLEKTNRVAVYSPRFAAVSVISTLAEGTIVDHIDASHVTEFGVNYHSEMGATAHIENLGSERVRTRSRASDLDRDLMTTYIDKTEAALEASKIINTFEDYQFIRSGELIGDELAAVQKSVQAAIEWSQNEYPVVAARTDGAQEVYKYSTAQELAAPDDPPMTKGRIRVVKMADKRIATKGETVTFTIRYDNVGDLPVTDVAIIDNLTVRLSYIEETQTSDRKGKFVTEDNGAGSLILRWELDEPLAGGEGGVVTFQARVE